MSYPLSRRPRDHNRQGLVAFIASAAMVAGGLAGGAGPAGAAGAAPLSPDCTPVLAGEFADTPRSSAAPPRRPELNLVTAGHYCLAEDMRQEKLLDHRGRELAARGGDALVLIGADDVVLDLQGHTVLNARTPGYTLVRQDRHVPGRVQSHWFAGTVVRNGRLSSPGSAGTAIRLVSAQRYGPRGFGDLAALAPDQSLPDVFRRTAHRLEHLVIDAGRRAILIDGRDNVIRNNRIVVDGYTAIVAQGPGIVIEDNLIEVRGDLSALTAHEQAGDGAHPFVIRLIQADGAVVRNNRVRLRDGAAPLAAAVELVASRGVTLEGNHFDGVVRGVHADEASGYQESGDQVRPCGPRGTRTVPPEDRSDGTVVDGIACR